MHGTTGTWEEKVIDYSIQNTHIVAAVIMFICLCGATLSIRYLWRAILRDKFKHLWNKAVRNPISWAMRPIRRWRRQWSARNLRVNMAKWKREIVANVFYDALSQACDQQLINKHEKRKLMKKMAEFFDIPDLRRPSKDKRAIEQKIKENTTHAAGPAQAKPAWGDKPKPIEEGDFIGPPIESLGSKFLNRKKVA